VDIHITATYVCVCVCACVRVGGVVVVGSSVSIFDKAYCDATQLRFVHLIRN
jgi:hypothetical protein